RWSDDQYCWTLRCLSFQYVRYLVIILSSNRFLEKSCLFSDMRPIFCGNLDYDARQSEIERLFGKYGRVERVDMKTGKTFVYMEDERDAEDAIHRLDRTDFGRKARRLPSIICVGGSQWWSERKWEEISKQRETNQNLVCD
uniref:RRM domain-containing protein n=1 Tax=Aegilops tauschii subsp. strangulata TaxID=200361 RepID=A0A453N059_AEGTS